MQLFYREYGSGEPLIILHGLYGSSDNWVSIGRELAKDYRVILIDQRNHGQSPHSFSHNYQDMANDLFEMIQSINLQNVNLIGHSMGGKTAMLFTHLNQKIVKSLIVVDISPAAYTFSRDYTSQEKVHRQIISALILLDLESLSSRQQADEILSMSISDERVRQFLLKNLKREHNGKFSWILNLESLSQNLHSLMDSVFEQDDNGIVSVPTLFIKGGQSPYINSSNKVEIEKRFSDYSIQTIPDAGHWVHAEQPVLFLKTIKEFLKTSS